MLIYILCFAGGFATGAMLGLIVVGHDLLVKFERVNSHDPES